MYGDIRDVYERSYSPPYPVVYIAKKPYQLLGYVREHLTIRPSGIQKINSEYVHNSIYSIFAFVEPLGDRHHNNVRKHHTALDWIHEIKYLSDKMFPDATKSFWEWTASIHIRYPHYIGILTTRSAQDTEML